MQPLVRPAFRSAALASSILAAAAIAAGAIRVLPWLFDPAVPWRVAAPFARGLASIALEAALLVGWPVGWALASARLVESGEARVLETLGERPSRTIARLAPQAVFFAALVGSIAVAWGRDANEPGRVATELIAQARASCAQATQPTAYAVPFTQLTWLCAPNTAHGAPGVSTPAERATTPRLVGASPGALSGTMFSAADARIAGDFRAIDLEDGRLVLSTSPPTFVHVGHLGIRGLAPWSRASTLPFYVRALLFATTGAVGAILAAYAALRRAARGRMSAIAVGAAGPLAALAIVRVLERADAPLVAYALVPVTAAAATCFTALLTLLQQRRARRG